MSKTKIQKQEIIQKLKDKLASSGFIAFLNFHKLSVAKSIDLRRALKKTGGDYVVSKKTLISIAAKESGLDVDKKKLEGEIGVVVAGKSEDAILAISKEIVLFAKKNAEMLKIIGGIWSASANPPTGGGGGAWANADQIKRLAAIPPREVLLTQLAFIVSQPMANLARVLKEVETKIKN